MTVRALAAVLLLVAACKPEPLPAPDPAGRDLVKGAVVAASEATGIRLYKVVHVEEYPDPIGDELSMVVYDPKVKSFEDAQRLWKKERERVTVLMPTMQVMRHLFIKRDHRVVANEPVTDEELAPTLKSRNSRGAPLPSQGTLGH